MGRVRSMLFCAVHFFVSLLPSYISSRVYATLFLLDQSLDLKISDELTTTDITLKGNDIASTIISASTNVSSHTRTVVILHGMGHSADKDPRIVKLANAIAGSDPKILVVLPYLAPLARHRMDEGIIELLLHVIEAVASDPSLCPSGRISVAAACISGGFGIVAASRSNRIESMLCIGPHATVQNFLVYAKERLGQGDSRYGLNATLSGFLTPPNERLSTMLAAYCKDDHCKGLKKKSNELAPLLQKYPAEAEIYRRLHNDDEFLIQKLDEMYSAHEDELLAMSPLEMVDKVKLERLVILHAERDDIIPPSESVLLFEAFQRNSNVHVSMMVTSLLNHGDQRALQLQDVVEVFKLVNCFSAFF